jgi:hypothetical protein
MTLRQLWLMAAGRREEWRKIVIGQAWAIGSLFGEPASTDELAQFIRTGCPGDSAVAVEPKNHLVDEKVAEFLRTGKLIVE